MALIISTGELKEVLFNGTIISFKDEPLIFQIAADLKIIFNFKNDKEKVDQNMSFNAPNNKELNIVLTNFNSSLGTGNTEPLPVATFNNRQLYLNFIVYALNDASSKNVHYTFYLREEVLNG